MHCPSEAISLPLDNLDWQRGAIKVIAPKTEGHGQGTRTTFKKIVACAGLEPWPAFFTIFVQAANSTLRGSIL